MQQNRHKIFSVKKKKNIEKSELISPKDILIGQLKDGILSFL